MAGEMAGELAGELAGEGKGVGRGVVCVNIQGGLERGGCRNTERSTCKGVVGRAGENEPVVTGGYQPVRTVRKWVLEEDSQPREALEAETYQHMLSEDDCQSLLQRVSEEVEAVRMRCQKKVVGPGCNLGFTGVDWALHRPLEAAHKNR
jgi:hypothetical protein